MRIWPIARLLRNVEGSLKGTMAYMEKEAAYEELKEASGEDFGDDIAAWANWYNTVKPDGGTRTFKPSSPRPQK